MGYKYNIFKELALKYPNFYDKLQIVKVEKQSTSNLNTPNMQKGYLEFQWPF